MLEAINVSFFFFASNSEREISRTLRNKRFYGIKRYEMAASLFVKTNKGGIKIKEKKEEEGKKDEAFNCFPKVERGEC